MTSDTLSTQAVMNDERWWRETLFERPAVTTSSSVAAVTPGNRVEEALPLVREVLTLLNTNTNSVLPHLTRDVLDRWIR